MQPARPPCHASAIAYCVVPQVGLAPDWASSVARKRSHSARGSSLATGFSIYVGAGGGVRPLRGHCFGSYSKPYALTFLLLSFTSYRTKPETEFELWCHARISWMYARPISGKPRKSEDSLGKSHLSSVRLDTLRRAANSSRVIPSWFIAPRSKSCWVAG